MFRKFGKTHVWLVVGGALLLPLFYFMLLIVNRHDVPPSEEAIRFAQLYVQRPQISDDDNAFVYLVGMGVRAGYEPILAGKAMLMQQRLTKEELATATKFHHVDFPSGDFRGSRGVGVADYMDACRNLNENCTQFLDGNLSWVKLSPSDSEQIERYVAMTRMSSWLDHYSQGFLSPTPSFEPAISAQKLLFLSLLKNASFHSLGAVMEQLNADAAFWRMVLRSSDHMLTSMSAAAALRRNLHWSNLLIRRFDNKLDLEKFNSIWKHSISDEERNMERAWVGEYIWLDQLLQDAVNHGGQEILGSGERDASLIESLGYYLVGPLYNAQDASNRAAQRYAGLNQLAKMPFEQLLSSAYRWTQAYNNQMDKEFSLFYALYNPVGKTLVDADVDGKQGYIFTLANLEGARRALLATLELRNNKTPPNKIAEALAASSWRNPYSNEPFQWDEATGSVVFEGLGEGSSKRYSFIY